MCSIHSSKNVGSTYIKVMEEKVVTFLCIIANLDAMRINTYHKQGLVLKVILIGLFDI